MNRPRRPVAGPPRRKPSGPPPATDLNNSGPPRRRSPLDSPPSTVEPKFKVLGTGVDRQALVSSALPMELAVVHGFTREIEEAAQKFHGRPDDFWRQHPQLLETARKLDEVLANLQARRGGR